MSILTLALAALALQDSPWTETRFHRVHLRNGNFIDGRLLRSQPDEVMLEVKAGAELGVRRDLISKVEFVRIRSYRDRELPAVIVAEPEAEAVEAAPAVAAAPAEAPSAFSAEIRRAVEMTIAAYATANRDTRRPLGRRIQELGPEAVAYACTLCRRGQPLLEPVELVEAVARIDAPAVLPALLETAAGAGDVFARAAAVRELARRGGPLAARALLKSLDDPSALVWRIAAEEVASLTRKGEVEVGTLIGMLRTSSEKGVLARILGQIGDDAGLQAIHELLQDGTARDRIAALQALASFRREEDAELAAGLLDDEETEVRKNACIYLGRVKHEAAAKGLIERLDDEDEGVADVALWALRQISGQTYGKDAELWERWESRRP